MNPHEVFVAARELISEPESWCKKTQGRTADGEHVFADDPRAVSFCILGSIARVKGLTGAYSEAREVRMMASTIDYPDVYHHPLSRAARFHPAFKVAEWNNDPKTTHSDILAKLDEMIELTRPCHKVSRTLEEA